METKFCQLKNLILTLLDFIFRCICLFFQSFVRMVLLSYLELLVNTRSELALARVLNVPNRDLTHEAFTELKREAKKKNMTMYQVIFIFVRLISLIFVSL